MRRPYTVLYVLSALLLLFSWITWQERVIFTDAAFHLYYALAHDETPVKYRFLGELIHGLPLWFSRWGIDLSTIAQSYSVWIAALPLIVGLQLRRWEYAFVVFFAVLIMPRHSYYWCVSELPLAIAMTMWIGTLLDRELTIWRGVMIVVLTVTIIFSHPLAVVFLGFWLCYQRADRRIGELLSASGLIIVLFLCKMVFFSSHDDGGKIGRLAELGRRSTEYWAMMSWDDLFGAFSTYTIPILLFTAAVTIFYKKKTWLKLMLLLGGGLYILFINVLFATDSEQFYIENMYYPLSGILAVILIFDIIPMIVQKYRSAALLGIGIICIAQMFMTRRPYQQRIEWLSATIAEYGDKAILPENQVDMSTVMMSWGTPYESWLLSTIESGDSQSIIVSNNTSEYDHKVGVSKELVTVWESISYEDLPSRYFMFSDSIEYHLIR